MEEIDATVSNIKKQFKDNKDLEQTLENLYELSNSLGKSTKQKGIHKNSGVYKAIGKGNFVDNIPSHLSSYKNFLSANNNSEWLSWMLGGEKFLDQEQGCPYCVTKTPQEKVELIKSVSKTYNPKEIQHLNKLKTVLDELNEYLSPDTYEKLKAILNNIDGLTEDEESFLKEIKNHLERLILKLSALKEISYFSFQEGEDIGSKLEDYIIDIKLLGHLQSEKTNEMVKKMNESLQETLSEIGRLTGQIKHQQGRIRSTIKSNEQAINAFLAAAGYSYYVCIEPRNSEYVMQLRHKDYEPSITESSKHLSYGERNAFALILFMYESLSKKVDLIILDDPISSFDKNKKFAIIDKLFRGKSSFNNQTVLMMTHDFEPIIDMKHTLKHHFGSAPPAVHFLENDGGSLIEKEIKSDDISSFSDICMKNVQSSTSLVIQLIYLRRFYEFSSQKNMSYQLLSNLIHRRDTPILFAPDGSELEMSNDQIKAAEEAIARIVKNFSYKTALSSLNNTEEMVKQFKETSSNYEKLQIFRIIFDNNLPDDPIIKKFINEAFHIENDYILQINPQKYNTVPNHVIEKCSEYLNDQYPPTKEK